LLDHEYQMLAALHHAFTRFQKCSANGARAEGLRALQHEALLIVRTLGAEASSRRIAEAMGLSASRRSQLISGLCAKGLLRRQRVDAGPVRLVLTEEAEAKLRRLDREDRAEVERTLTRISDVVEGLPGEAAE